ncbi:hypothetical protein BTO30_15900 [Domibacillus antri]|uniref:Uncharacterized protein n=1 Tax=Domibacillus antri TaxID=1714264 RepID=A0A1Q8Q1S9_9BACI|nr:hypothetical protein BTO30_15900 [Domibacillus antri]
MEGRIHGESGQKNTKTGPKSKNPAVEMKKGMSQSFMRHPLNKESYFGLLVILNSKTFISA